MKCNVGCSGFSYKEWKDVFYPEKLPQKKWFEFYCKQFNTLELNVTFYRFPTAAILQNWNNRSPEDFCFSLKAPRLITHYKKLSDTDELLKDFYASCRTGLQKKLGPILFQFPKQFVYTKENLDKIVNNLDDSYINVVEFRHCSWWTEEVYTQLAKKKIIFSGISYPGLPAELIMNTSSIYYRFHGIPKIYYSGYKETELKKIADTIIAAKDIKNVYCYFNNTAATAAIENAKWLDNYLINRENK